MIALYHCITNLALLDSVWFETRTGNEKQFIPVNTLASEYDSSIYLLLRAIYAISGCDSVSSFSLIDKKRISDTWKDTWWVDRYAWLWQLSITLFGICFRSCSYSVHLLSVPGEHNSSKYQWMATWNVYKSNIWRSIATNFGCFSFSCVQSGLSNIYLEVCMNVSIEPTITNWK